MADQNNTNDEEDTGSSGEQSGEAILANKPRTLRAIVIGLKQKEYSWSQILNALSGLCRIEAIENAMRAEGIEEEAVEPASDSIPDDEVAKMLDTLDKTGEDEIPESPEDILDLLCVASGVGLAL